MSVGTQIASAPAPVLGAGVARGDGAPLRGCAPFAVAPAAAAAACAAASCACRSRTYVAVLEPAAVRSAEMRWCSSSSCGKQEYESSKTVQLRMMTKHDDQMSHQVSAMIRKLAQALTMRVMGCVPLRLAPGAS